ncbi:zinc finger BED domain-containing protein RICESLEEPER 2-like [Miscanthus floridulus]|uniref:zinc finger BED domain-containing protein RICESLEEPER 2-like n=1 Tax=Miscanthus floridulus TaxID=154761 RepID=UPI00345AF4A5
MRCAAHIVNLIVRDGLQEVDLSIKHVRAAIRYIKNGTSRLLKFKEIAEEEKVDSKAFLKLDVPIRWNYTYLMLKAAIVYEKVFLKLAEDDTNYVIDLSEARDGFGHPDEDDWDNAKKMAQFLHHFHDLTVRISSSLQVTCNTFFHEIGEVHLLIQEWLNSEDNLQVSMGMRTKEKFDKYWGLWHTSSKDNDMQQQEQDRDKGRSKGRGRRRTRTRRTSIYSYLWLHSLIQEYRNMYAPSEETTQVIDADQSKRGAGGMLKEKIAKRMKLSNCSTSTNKSELEKYLAEDTKDTEKKMDILGWWKGPFARFDINPRPRMASHGISWVSGAHVRFGDLDLILTVEGELAWAPVVVQPFHSTNLDAVTKALEELRLHTPEVHARGSGQLLDFDYGRLVCQLGAFLGP